MKIQNCFCFNNTCEDFSKWLIELLGPVILGAKAGEIISFPTFAPDYEQKMYYVKELFKDKKSIKYREIDMCGQCRKIFFYNPQKMDRVLSDSRIRKFLDILDYPRHEDSEAIFDYFIEKMHTSSEFPHEIGIFLGYPLKDVMGFMGYGSLKLTKTHAWKVYGDSRISDMVYKEIREARDFMRSIIQDKSVCEILQVI